MLKVNYSDLCGKSRVQIEKEANKRGIRYNRFTETRDIIGMIIAHDAYYEGQDDARKGVCKLSNHTANEPKEGRGHYIITDDSGNNYNVALTPDQARAINWAIDKELMYDCTMTEIEEKNFKAL